MIKNEYSKLKSVIIGRDLDIPQRIFDISFNAFFKKNIKDLDLTSKYKNEFTSKILNERNEDLDNFAKELESRGIKVYRPEKINFKKIITPEFESILFNSSNVRDQTFIYKNKIIETTANIRGRFFENYTLHKIFKEYYIKGYNWVKTPTSYLSDECIDDLEWNFHRDFNNIDFRFDVFFDAANMIKMNDDIFYNYSSYNHYLGIKWLKDNIDANIIPLQITDNHIDGNIASLNEYTFLVNDRILKKSFKDILPNKYKDFKYIRIPDNVKDEYCELPSIASKEGMSINILSISPKDVMINKNDESTLGEILYNEGFNVIPIQLRYCRAFGGGLHCVSLDLERE